MPEIHKGRWAKFLKICRPKKGLMSVKITKGYTLVQLSLASLVDRTVYQRRSLEVSVHPLELQKAEESSDG